MMSVVKSPQIAMYGQKPYASSAEYRPPLTSHGRPQLSRSELALIALEKARAMPHGRERTEALRKAGMLQNDVAAQGIIFCETGQACENLAQKRRLGYG